MFTDIYFTNLTPLPAGNTRIAFFQKTEDAARYGNSIFKVIEQCQHGWSHKVRVPWQLSFRLVKSCGSVGSLYPLKTVYRTANKKFLIFKDGVITVLQSYGNGKQIIDFEQLKGNSFSGVQVYRGAFLIAEMPFFPKTIRFQIDTQITIIENAGKSEQETIELASKQPFGAINLDLTGIRRIYLTINKKMNNQLSVKGVEKW